MALTKVTKGVRTIATDEVGATEIAAGAVGASEIAATIDLSSKTVTLPAASVTAHVTQTDTTGIEDDIALLGFRVASNGSLAKYNLVEQTIDAFEDASGVNASTSTNEARNNAGNYYSGQLGSETEFHTTNASYATVAGTIISKIIVIGGGGAGGSNSGTGTDGWGSGAGGGAWAGAVNYTVGSGITSINVTVGTGGAKTGTSGNGGGLSRVVFGSDLTITANGGDRGNEESSGGAGGTATKSGTSSGAATTLLLSGGAGGIGNSSGSGTNGANGATGTLDSVSYTSSGGGGGGSGSGQGGTGGNGLAASFSGGGGGGGSDSGTAGLSNGGTGYGTSGKGFYDDGQEDAGSVVIDSLAVFGGTGGTGTSGNERSPRTNAGGGGMCGGGGGGGGDGGYSGTGNAGDGGQGYVFIDSASIENMTLISTTTAAQAAPTKGDIVFTYDNGAGSTTLGGGSPDVTAEISADGGSTWTAMTLASEGSTGSHNIATAHDVTITSTITSPYNMAYRIKTFNQSLSKTTRIQAVSLGWS